MSIRLRTAPSSGPLAERLAAEIRPEDLVLVGSQLMERETRWALQLALKGPAPDVRTLGAWLDEQAWLQAEDGTGTVVVSPRERPLLIEEWIRTDGFAWESTWGHPDMIRALSDVLALGARASVPMSALDASVEPVRVLQGFEKWFDNRGYVWREALPGFAFTPERDWHPWKRVWIHQVDHLTPSQWKAMDRYRDFWKANAIPVEILVCDTGQRYAARTVGRWGVEVETVRTESATPDPVFREAANPVDEIESVFTAVLDRLNVDSDATLRDFSVLVGDLSAYRSSIESVAREWGIPVRITQGAPFRSHPVAARWLRLFAWRMRGFRMDDAYAIFADPIIYPTEQMPDMRALLKGARDTNEPMMDRFRPVGERPSDVAYLATQLERLIAIRDRLPSGNAASMEDWCQRWLTVMSSYRLRPNEEVRTVSRRLEVMLNGLKGTYRRLKLTRTMDEPTWLRAVETWLSGFTQQPEDRPDALLVTEIHHMPETHGKIVFMIGMADGSYPRYRENPVLRRFGSAWRRALDAAVPDALDEARHHVARVAASAAEWRLSRPLRIGGSEKAPSLLWTLYAARSADRNWPRPSGAGWKPAPDVGVAARVRAMEQARRNPDPRAAGMYEGRLGPLAAARAWALLCKSQDDGTSRLPLSISRLDLLAASPIDFFFRYVLAVDPGRRFLDDADPSTKGQVLHECLKDLFTIGAGADIPALVDRVMGSRAAALGHEDGPFRAILRHQLIRMLTNEAQVDLGGYTPVWLEHRFEFDTELPATPPIPVRVTGVVDRMDSDGYRSRIIDYKTYSGKLPTNNRVENGLSYQMPVYRDAARRAGFNPEMAGYLVLPLQKGPAGREEKWITKDVDWVESATTRIRDVRDGNYPLPVKEPDYGETFRPIRRLDKAVIEARKGAGDVG